MRRRHALWRAAQKMSHCSWRTLTVSLTDLQHWTVQSCGPRSFPNASISEFVALPHFSDGSTSLCPSRLEHIHAGVSSTHPLNHSCASQIVCGSLASESPARPRSLNQSKLRKHGQISLIISFEREEHHDKPKRMWAKLNWIDPLIFKTRRALGSRWWISDSLTQHYRNHFN